ncbi:hypothetical protein H4Q26_006291 [Puccinia striiformis f. sp. tritici PST-130]|nr:hypothetical protein H4Q26_006291 [Puccinia striiformis f. sp. tritici PST-130]
MLVSSIFSIFSHFESPLWFWNLKFQESDSLSWFICKFTRLKCRAKYPASEFEDSIALRQVVLRPICSSKVEETTQMEASKKAGLSHHKQRNVKLAYRSHAVLSDDDPDIDWVDLGLMKPDIIFFAYVFIIGRSKCTKKQGEGLPTEFDEAIGRDRFECDLVIVIGTSLQVAPVSEIIKYVPDGVPQISINWDPIYHGRRKITQTQGEGGQLDQPSSLPGVISTQNNSLANPLSGHQEQKQDISINEGNKPIQFSQFGQHINHIWLFPGANVTHTWFDKWRILNQAGGNPSNGIKISAAPKSQTPDQPIKIFIVLLKKTRKKQ